MNDDVCVIIPARDAAATVATAVASALAEPETTSVVLVDDGSVDGTAEAAWAADDGTRRLRILRNDTSAGPSAARNRAIAASREPLLAVLDADDAFLPGRFGRLLAEEGWDLVADNIAFVGEHAGRDPRTVDVGRFEPRPTDLDLEGFVRGNVRRRGPARSELGFLKPLMRRDFLERHGLAYDERLRFAEDYRLYTLALAAGARFRLIRSCGYAALERPGSLSGDHPLEPLALVADLDRELAGRPGLSRGERRALRLHEREMRARHRHRRFLATRRDRGSAAAIAEALRDPGALRDVPAGILRDKAAALAGSKPARSAPPLRYLLAPGAPTA